jgi:RNA polymerase sigma-70 factor (ECF subfamily)
MPEPLSDAVLLERFLKRREEAAFATLVARHGPLVEGICRRVLRNDHDVEDVYQATFFVLARKASCIPWQESVGGWLRTVAHRLALHARAELIRRRSREHLSSTLAASCSVAGDVESSGFGVPDRFHPRFQPSAELERRDLRRLIDDEVQQLPEKYRAAVVLCDLEGRTHEEAAKTLGWPTGSMSRRLERARVLLRERLTDRGVSLSLFLLLALGLAVCGIRTSPRETGRHSAGIRQAMLPFRPLSAGGQGWESVLGELVQGKLDGHRVRLANLAEHASLAADKLDQNRPAQQPEQWREWTSEMRRAATQLALASREEDPIPILVAARRLNTSCLQCHEVFRH